MFFTRPLSEQIGYRMAFRFAAGERCGMAANYSAPVNGESLAFSKRARKELWNGRADIQFAHIFVYDVIGMMDWKVYTLEFHFTNPFRFISSFV
jgi:hypothetical protein